eukprot:Tbor_TRINITY_DN5809_c6_g7::TRINITY_DN5809_c6_g7_i1::g.7076::m.7076/K07199/PRKAB; 5'-AMP-activated protein kinase, regulatory beta subunit
MGNKDSRPAESPKTGIRVVEPGPSNSLLIRNPIEADAMPNTKHCTSNSDPIVEATVPDSNRPLAPVAHDPAPKVLPVLIRYTAKDAKARISQGQQMEVIFIGDNDFDSNTALANHNEIFKKKAVKMTASEDNFFAFVHLPQSSANFIFLANEQEYLLDPTQPIINHPIINKKVNTIVSVNEILLQTKDDDDGIDDPTGWGQEHTQFEETRKFPPIMPPHLRYTPLNTPPTQVRCAADGRMASAYHDGSVEHISTVARLDAEHLPLPLSVTINHVYVQRREDHTVTGITTRYRDKYTTIVYYSRREVGVF